MEIYILIICVITMVFILINTWFVYSLMGRSSEAFMNEVRNEVRNFEKALARNESILREEFSRNREENSGSYKAFREEMGNLFKNFEDSILKRIAEMSDFQKGRFEGFATQLAALTKSNEDKIEGMARTVSDRLAAFNDQINKSSRETRTESAESLKSFENRLTANFKEFNDAQDKKSDALISKQNDMMKLTDEKIEKIRSSNEAQHELTNRMLQEKLNYFNEQINSNAKDNRSELSKSLKSFEETFSLKVNDFNELQKQKFDGLTNRQSEMIEATDKKLDHIRVTIEEKLKLIQDDSTAKLEKIRETVDEKLHKTLEQRLGDSFKLVSERLELVHKGLGEMQTLATGVGDLKKVLSNVKTKGVLGEYQLENILEQLLTHEQYSRNVKTKAGSDAIVEFAIRLPGKDEKGKGVWLPVDSKFPTEHYQALSEAYDAGNVEAIEEGRKLLGAAIRKCAKDISEKYLDPPNTTDFGVLFLPFEGLYAEVLRINGIFEAVQRDFKVIITGPTTLSALLNSLQIGFKTLAIEKRSSEVWALLGAVKTEFVKFGDVLDKTQKKLDEASKVISSAGVRTRAIERKLRNVERLPAEETAGLLGDATEEPAAEDGAEEDE